MLRGDDVCFRILGIPTSAASAEQSAVSIINQSITLLTLSHVCTDMMLSRGKGL